MGNVTAFNRTGQKRTWLRVNILTIVGWTFLIFLILIPRILPFPSIYFTDDEIQIGKWTSQMSSALLSGDWRNTANNAYPAVTLAWIEAIQVGFLEPLPGQTFNPHQMLSDAGDDVFAQLPRRRLALALLNTAMLLGAFWLLQRLYNTSIAVVATILMALDPFLLTQARVFRTEGITTGFMLLSALAIILYAKEQRSRWLIISAILGGLATLTKITSFYLFLFTGLTLLTWPLMTGERNVGRLLKQTSRDVSLYGLIMTLTFFALWPALWVAPVETFRETFSYLQAAATNIEIIWGGEGSAFFFRGEILREDPGVLFYIWSVAYRATPLAVFGVGLWLMGGVLLLFRLRHRRVSAASAHFRLPYFPVSLLIVAYTLFYFIAMSLGVSKVDRYLMPIFPGFSILAAVGFQILMDELTSRLRPAWSIVAGTWSMLLILSVWLVAPQHPYYFTYWNPLLGGAKIAVKELPAGGRQGINMMIEHLNTLPNAETLNLVGPGIRDCEVVFTGNCLQPSAFLQADYIIDDIFSVQRGVYLSNVESLFPSAQLIHKYAKDGVDYAWLYKLPSELRDVDQWLGTHGKLRGYALSAAQIGAGDTLDVTIFWINGEDGWTLSDSEFFVKLRDEYGRVQQIVPAKLRSDASPNPSLAQSMLVFDAQLDLSPDTALGLYTLELGLRLQENKEETWVFDLSQSENTVVVNRGFLGNIEYLPIEPRLDYSFSETNLTLLGYNQTTQGNLPYLDLFWTIKKPETEDYLLKLALIDDTGRIAVSWMNSLAPSLHPVREWVPNEIVKVSFPLMMGYQIPPGEYQLQLSLFAQDQQPLNGPVDTITAPLMNDVLPSPFESDARYRVDQATFGLGLDLLGYDLEGRREAAKAGLLSVRLYWLNRYPFETFEAEIEVFDETGESIAQQILPLPVASDQLGGPTVSYYELSLTGLPALMTLRTRAVNSDLWSEVQLAGKVVPERKIVIDDLLSKIAVAY